ncbi:MAG: deoxyribodipyrimidine photo-lyase [Methyloligella sp. ZOD6]
MAGQTRPVIMWFRRDLRLSDNPALAAAAKAGAPLLSIFILDDKAAGRFRPGGASRWWLHGSLEALSESLGGHLVLRRGETAETIEALLDETGAAAIHTAAAYEPYERGLEAAVEKLCKDRAVTFERHEGRLLNPPDSIHTNDGVPYRVFTPYWKAAKRKRFRALLKAPKLGDFANVESDALDDWNLRPRKPDWGRGLAQDMDPRRESGQGGARGIHR